METHARVARTLLPFFTGLMSLAVIAGVALTSGCKAARSSERAGAPAAGRGSAQRDPVEEQIQLQRFVDDYLALAGQALDESAERMGTENGRFQVLRLKLISGSSLLGVVSGPNPMANLLDLVSVTVLTRKSVEDYWMKTTNGAAFQPWLEASQVLETNAWQLASQYLEQAEVKELRGRIDEWYARSPEIRTAFFSRPQTFSSMVRPVPEKEKEVHSVLRLIYLDPTVGLDPAVREVTRSRLLAERGMFTMQRLPFLLRLQGELMAYNLAAQPSIQLAISNSVQVGSSVERISLAAEHISASINALPDRLTAERRELLATLEPQEGKLRDLVVEVNHALNSGEKMSDSLSTTITNFNAVLKTLGTDKESTNTFQILDYATTAREVSQMAKDVNTMIDSFNKATPGVERLSRQTGSSAQELVEHGFRLGLVLVAAFLGGGVLAGLFLIFVAHNLKRKAGPERTK